jgi:UDP-N-acetyl-2-amino-2-deoxyglucuronate dehydrogenase
MSLRVGFVGTGAIARLHAQAHRNIGNLVCACTSLSEEEGRQFTAQFGGEFFASYEDVCRHPDVDIVDVCTFPDFRLQPLERCAEHGKHVQVEKPIATNLATARQMIDTAQRAGIVLGVVSQHRFDDASRFLAAAIPAGRLGRLIQCDAYVKWHRSDAYYSRPIKGSWATEGGGALINQAIHQVDLLRWLVGPVRDIAAMWQIGATHAIESEDVVSALLRYENGATGVIQASTSIVPGYPERLELHGTKGTAVISGDRLVAWDVPDDSGDPAPVATNVASGASDPMAISLTPFERQFKDFEDAVRTGRAPLISGEAGYQALEIVTRIYEACGGRV